MLQFYCKRRRCYTLYPQWKRLIYELAWAFLDSSCETLSIGVKSLWCCYLKVVYYFFRIITVSMCNSCVTFFVLRNLNVGFEDLTFAQFEPGTNCMEGERRGAEQETRSIVLCQRLIINCLLREITSLIFVSVILNQRVITHDRGNASSIY